MNSRTLLVIAMIAILGLGLVLVIQSLLQQPPTERTLTPAIAAAQIPPYTYITQDMVKVGREMRLRDAQTRGAYPVDAVVGLMSTDLIAPGDLLTGVNAKPIEQVRAGVKDLGLELVSFSASGERGYAGHLRAGHIINLYGNGSDKSTHHDFTELIAPRLWVVDVSSSGEPAVVETPRPDPVTGEYAVQPGARNRPANTITVAVPPQTALHIIESIGTRHLDPWVTLAANQTVSAALATPQPAPTALNPNQLPPDLAGTATALWRLVNATKAPPLPHTGEGGGR